jgi:hypothetical protein
VIEQYFKEAQKLIQDARQGIVIPHMELVDMTTEKQLRMSSRLSFGTGSYMIVVGPSGTGKTAFVDTEIVLNPILQQFLREPSMRQEIEVIYRAQERPPRQKIVKWISYLLWWKERRLVDLPTLLQLTGKKRALNDEDMAAIDRLSPYMEFISDSVTLIGGAKTPQELYDYALDRIQQEGAYFHADMHYVYRNGVKMCSFNGEKFGEQQAELEFGKDKKGNQFVSIKRGNREILLTQQGHKYVPKNPKKLRVHVVDTINKLRGDDTLKTLNAWSRYAGELRDADAGAFVDISQMSKDDMKSMDKKMHITQGHIKGSGDIPNNADIILSLIDPLHYDITEWGNDGEIYDVTAMQGSFRLGQIVKNTHGDSIHKFPFVMLGENGYFYELPQKGMTANDYAELHEKIFKYRGAPPPDAQAAMPFKDIISSVKVTRRSEEKNPF